MKIPRWIHVPWFIVALAGWLWQIVVIESRPWAPIWYGLDAWSAPYTLTYWVFFVAFWSWYWVVANLGRAR